MIKTLVIALILSFGGVGLSAINFGYSRAGEKYIAKQRKARKSIRPGYYYGGRHYGSGGFRGGK